MRFERQILAYCHGASLCLPWVRRISGLSTARHECNGSASTEANETGRKQLLFAAGYEIVVVNQQATSMVTAVASIPMPSLVIVEVPRNVVEVVAVPNVLWRMVVEVAGIVPDVRTGAVKIRVADARVSRLMAAITVRIADIEMHVRAT